MTRGESEAVRLLVITDHRRWSEAHIAQRVTMICEGAIPNSVIVQLRDRQLPEVERLRIGRQLRQITRQGQQGLVVSDRLDLAVLVEADGVALPEGGVGPGDARALLVSKGIDAPWISCAWHDALRLPDPEATVCVLSPIAEARKGRGALGLGQLTRFRGELPAAQLLFALGGIDASNAAQCLHAGAQGVAVMGAAFDSEPMSLVSALGIARG
jgi:thiamine-phosphate pyrophosphorylase